MNTESMAWECATRGADAQKPRPLFSLEQVHQIFAKFRTSGLRSLESIEIGSNLVMSY